MVITVERVHSRRLAVFRHTAQEAKPVTRSSGGPNIETTKYTRQPNEDAGQRDMYSEKK